MSEVKECCPCPTEEINVPITGITVPFCGFGVNIDASKLPKCECEIASPEKDGLVPQGGKADQYYGVNEEGTAYGFKDFPVANKEKLGGIIVGDGLDVEDSGRVSVDFSKMPTDKFEELLKSLRVPQWLTDHRTWYVRTDGDDKNDGTENTPEKAFRTIQHAVNYVSENFNIGAYRGTIKIAEGTYEESVVLPKYTASTGSMSIIGEGATTIIKAIDNTAFYAGPSLGVFYISNISCEIYAQQSTNANSFPSGIRVERGSSVLVSHMTLTGYETGDSMATIRLLSTGGGDIYVYDGVVFNAHGRSTNSLLECMLAQFGGHIRQEGNGSKITVSGTGNAVLVCGERGFFTRSMNSTPHPIVEGSFIGKNYVLYVMSLATSGEGKENYFCATLPGEKDSTSVYV